MPVCACVCVCARACVCVCVGVCEQTYKLSISFYAAATGGSFHMCMSDCSHALHSMYWCFIIYLH